MGSVFDSIWVPTLTAAFLTTYEGVVNPTWAQDICYKADDVGEFVQPVDLGTVGKVRLLNGKRQITKPQVYKVTQRNVAYELTLGIDIEDVNRDKLGMWEAKAKELGEKMIDHPNVLTIAQITTNPNCFDTTAFFGSSHPVNGTTQTNDLSATQMTGLNHANYTNATATAPTAVQMSDVVQQFIGQMMTLVDEVGDPINGSAKKFTFITSNPMIFAALNAAIVAMQLSQGQTNVVVAGMRPKGYAFDVQYDPRLGTTTTSVFYAFRTDSVIKPFIWGEEQEPEFSHQGEGSKAAFEDNQYQWGVKAVRSVGVGRYQHAFRLTLS